MRQDEQTTVGVGITPSPVESPGGGLNWGNAASVPVVALETPSPEELSTLLKTKSDVELRLMTATVVTKMLGGALFFILALTFGLGAVEVWLISQGMMKPDHRLITPSVLCVLVATPVAAVAAVIRQLGRYAFAVDHGAVKEPLVVRMASALRKAPNPGPKPPRKDQ